MKAQTNPISDAALNSVLAGHNTFISGSGGTGKSTMMDIALTMYGESAIPVGTTGLAAVILGGQTAHRTFSIPIGIPTEGCLKKPPSKYTSMLFGKNSPINTIILDEAGMLTSSTLWFIDKRLQKLKRNKKPFGGLQMVLVGDILQLPPVVRAEDYKIYNDYYSGYHFFSNPSFSGFNTFNLTKVYRQNNQEFVDVLSRIRMGTFTNNDLEYLNQRVGKASDKSVILSSTNKQVDYINASNIAKIKGESHSYIASHSGFKPNEYPLLECLSLKIGVRVLICANEQTTQTKPAYVNGDTGTVIAMYNDSVEVRLDKNGESVLIPPKVVSKSETRVDSKTNKLYKVDVGMFEQIPLKPAYSLTIHSSQGQTLDNVHLNLGSFITAGMTYVGLSRVRTLEGLTLERPLKASDIKVDEIAVRFLNNNANLGI